MAVRSGRALHRLYSVDARHRARRFTGREAQALDDALASYSAALVLEEIPSSARLSAQSLLDELRGFTPAPVVVSGTSPSATIHWSVPPKVEAKEEQMNPFNEITRENLLELIGVGEVNFSGRTGRITAKKVLDIGETYVYYVTYSDGGSLRQMSIEDIQGVAWRRVEDRILGVVR